MGRRSGEFPGKLDEANIVSRLERCFACPVLLEMMEPTEADRPFVGRLEGETAISPGSNVCAFDWQTAASGD
jgi:hypothetical protein